MLTMSVGCQPEANNETGNTHTTLLHHPWSS